MVSAASLKIYVPNQNQEINNYYEFLDKFYKNVKCTISSTFTLSEPTTSEPTTHKIFEVVITEADNNEIIAKFLRYVIVNQKTTWDTSDVTLVRE